MIKVFLSSKYDSKMAIFHFIFDILTIYYM